MNKESNAFAMRLTKPIARSCEGLLSGIEVAIKDVIDLKGFKTGAGNLTWFNEAKVASRNAEVIEKLLSQGARIVGKTITDELAFSLSGTNVHFGTPNNPKAKDRIPGGSSSGSASAVASGLVSVAIGTDTAGSTRVPASYCGIVGLRLSCNRVSMKGVVPLAPSFDTIGIFVSSAPLLSLVLHSLLEDSFNSETREINRLIIAKDFLLELDSVVVEAFYASAKKLAWLLGVSLEEDELFGMVAIEKITKDFRQQQMAEAWISHGNWVSKHWKSLGPGIADRFKAASKMIPLDESTFETSRNQLRQQVASFNGKDGLILLPGASSVAPLKNCSTTVKESIRIKTFRLTALASFTGLPQIVLPLAEVNSLPLGIGILGSVNDDELLGTISQLVYTRSAFSSDS